jgi:uncharacterized damage-inducible protein DinB
MTYYSGSDCGKAFRTVRKNTIQVAMDIPAEHWGFRATPDAMSVHEMLAHLAASTTWYLKLHGDDKKTFVSFEDFGAYIGAAKAFEQALDARETVLSALESEGEAFAALLDSMSEEAMAEKVSFPSPLEPKTRFEMLLGAKEHEMHHRAQLMVYERLLCVVPHLTRQRQANMAARGAQNQKN